MNINIPKNIKKTIEILKENGFEAFCVGGCVRDSLLGIKVNDWDITTNALPEDVKKCFEKSYDSGLKFGTVTINYRGNLIEITTYRNEGRYNDNRKPSEIFFTKDIKDDLSRRDFTINAMIADEHGTVFDYFNGIKDLEDKVIKTVGNPNERFTEDALRMLRALRFTSKLEGFSLDNSVKENIKKNCLLINNISKERISQEIIKVLESSNHPSVFFKLLYETKLMEQILPEMIPSVNFDQKTPYHHLDVFSHTLEVLDKTSKNSILRISALFHDIGKPFSNYWKEETTDSQTGEVTEGRLIFAGHAEKGASITESILKRLKFPNKTISLVTKLIKYHDEKIHTKEDIKKNLQVFTPKELEILFKLRIADIKGQKNNHKERISIIQNNYKLLDEIIKKREPYLIEHLSINGLDVFNITKIKNKEIYNYLKISLDKVIVNPELNTKEFLIPMIQDLHFKKVKKELNITGSEIMSILNIKESKEIGSIINSLTKIIMENPKHNTNEYLRNKVSNISNINNICENLIFEKNINTNINTNDEKN